MIDEKKIEEAAQDYAWDRCIPEEDGRNTFNIMKAFKAGVNWFKDSLLHDASEEPRRINKDDECVECLVKFKDGIICLYNYDDWHHWWESGIDSALFLEQISSWLYIEDLMKGGKQI